MHIRRAQGRPQSTAATCAASAAASPGASPGALKRAQDNRRARLALALCGHSASRRGLTLIEMAIVIIVIGILIGMIGSMISSIAFLQTTKDEAELLKEALVFCRRAAIKSNSTVYVELNIDENKYMAFRYKRTEGTLEKDVFLKDHALSDSNGIVAVALASGTKLESGTVEIPFSPDGIAEEIAVYMGPKPTINNTVLYSRYGTSARVVKGEEEQNLTDDNWKADLERR